MIYNFQTLPSNDNVNSCSYCIEVQQEMFIKKGKMIAYYGNLKFEALGSGTYASMVSKVFNAPSFMRDYVIVTGSGKLILGDNGNNIASYTLEDGDLTMKNLNVLGFQPSLTCLESTMPDYVTLIGTGIVLASSNGPAHFVEPPIRVDPEALLGWADVPSPSYSYDYSYVQGIMGAVGAMTGITASGEERQIDFRGKGTVLIQSSEEALHGPALLQRIVSEIPGLGNNELQHLAAVVSTRLRGQ